MANWLDSTLVSFTAGTMFGMTSSLLAYPNSWLIPILFVGGFGLCAVLYVYFKEGKRLEIDNKKLPEASCAICGMTFTSSHCPKCKTKRTEVG